MMDVMSKESIKKDDEYLVDLVKNCVCDNRYSWNKIPFLGGFEGLRLGNLM